MQQTWCRSACVTAAVLVAGVLTAGVRPAAGATPAEVQRAIDRAVEYVYSQQKPAGHWEEAAARTNLNAGGKPDGAQWGGWTAIATYALLAAGESPQDPRVDNAVQFLLKADVQGVYALGLRANVWNLLPPTDGIRAAIKKDANLLRASIKNTGQADGFFYYVANNKGDSYDHSVSQYGVLGLWALAQAGLEIPREDWLRFDENWRQHQYPDGSWSYQYFPDLPPDKEFKTKRTVSMTAAGVATLFITQDYVRTFEGVNCKGNLRDDRIDRGMDWLSRHYKPDLEPYALYGIERIGVASGYKYLGNIDWYERSADHLVKSQGTKGQWQDHGDLPGTCFGILFLVRGRAPVVMNKLDYSDAAANAFAAGQAPAAAAVAKPSPATAAKPSPQELARKNREADRARAADAVQNPWNQRPRDAFNIANWIGRQVERDLNFQIVNLNAPVDDLHDAPILYVAGNKRLDFTPEQKAKLKQYVEDGGLILGNADCGDADFATSFRKLGTELFGAYEFKSLPDTHVIYTNQQFHRSKWRRKPNILGLSNGVRELMVLFPDSDPAKAWQTQNPGGKEELYQIAANLFLYAVDKQGLRNKGETYLVKKDATVRPQRTISVARLIYPGNADPEPGGWRRLANVMNNDDKVALSVEPVKLGTGKLKGHGVAHLTGAGPLKLDEAARAEIKAFVAGGGTLVVDAAGGSTEFAAAVEDELGRIFGADDAKQLRETLPDGHKLYAADGKKLDGVGFRDWARANLGGEARTPRLRGIENGGRLQVVYSREDLSAGLVGQPVDGIIGYDPESATTLMRKILLHASADAKVAQRN